jgi:hypothetical protein
VAREQRKLAAIIAADVVGYSRLMGRDESGSLVHLREHGGGVWSQHSRDTAAGAGEVCVAPRKMPRRSRVPSQSCFHFLLRRLILRLGTMPHLLSFFQLPD